VEASRKHGSFDTRWSCVRRDGVGWMPDVSPGGPARLRLVETEPVPDESGTQRLLAAVAARDPRDPTGGTT